MICTKCKEDKILSEFKKDKRKRSGYSSWCRKCHLAKVRAIHDADPEKRKRYQKRFLETHPTYVHDRNRTPKRRYQSLKTAAKARNLPMLISFEQYVTLLKYPCTYCGSVFGKDEGGSGLDRVDNKQGYSLDNVIRSCGVCNETRGANWTVEETKAMINIVKQIRKIP